MSKNNKTIKADGGFTETFAMLEQVSNISPFLKAAAYVGVGVAADELRKQVNDLKVSTGRVKSGLRYCYQADKDALLAELGVTPIKDNGTVSVKVGFDGYYENQYGEQTPIPLIANSINAGTSFMYKQPFINKTKQKCEKMALEKMQKKLDEMYEKATS